MHRSPGAVSAVVGSEPPAGQTRPSRSRSPRRREFAAAAPNKIWTADITYIDGHSGGFSYLAFILDIYFSGSSRLVDGNPPAHRACGRCSGDGPLEANPGVGLIHHTDRGVQYPTALSFGKRLEEAGIVAVLWVE